MKRFSVLVVDDEIRILNFLKSKLKALSYEVLTASNGVEALEQVNGQAPDLIVLDLIMPKIEWPRHSQGATHLFHNTRYYPQCQRGRCPQIRQSPVSRTDRFPI